MKNRSVHAFVICWEGYEERARSISENIYNCVEYLSVIYSNPQGLKYSGLGMWQIVDNSWFFGKKFEHSINSNRGDIFLLIHADADVDDWQELVIRCRSAFAAFADLGVWAPNIDYTPWTSNRTSIGMLTGEHEIVAQTDGIVWALSCLVVERLKKFDYTNNNLGWGIDWAAIAFAFANRLLVLRDHSIHVRHPKGTGYQHERANLQMRGFLQQLTLQERLILVLLERSIALSDNLNMAGGHK